MHRARCSASARREGRRCPQRCSPTFGAAAHATHIDVCTRRCDPGSSPGRAEPPRSQASVGEQPLLGPCRRGCIVEAAPSRLHRRGCTCSPVHGCRSRRPCPCQHCPHSPALPWLPPPTLLLPSHTRPRPCHAGPLTVVGSPSGHRRPTVGPPSGHCRALAIRTVGSVRDCRGTVGRDCREG